jgi:hypothetical protein
VRLQDAENPSARALRIIEGHPLTTMQQAFYDLGCFLIETDEKGNALRAYRRVRI